MRCTEITIKKTIQYLHNYMTSKCQIRFEVQRDQSSYTTIKITIILSPSVSHRLNIR